MESTARQTEYEHEIRQLLDQWNEAFRARNLDRLMDFYASDASFFDGIAPLKVDYETYRKNWNGFFDWFPGPPSSEVRDLKITAADSVAFTSALVRLAGVKDGKEEGAWMRQSVGLEKRGGRWKITHEHWSLPIDMESGKGLTDLKPE